MSTIDQLLNSHASRLKFLHEHPERVEDETFKEALTSFLADVDILRAIPHILDCRIYGHALVVSRNPGVCSALITTTVFR